MEDVLFLNLFAEINLNTILELMDMSSVKEQQ